LKYLSNLSLSSRYFLIFGAPECSNTAFCIKDNEVGGACGTHGRGEISVEGFGGKA
jgi:hypothetical protein